MIGTLLRVDLLKIKRKGFWFLTFLGPLGVVSLQIVNYGVRKDYLLQQSDDDWLYYLDWVHAFTPLALVLGIAILTSFMASIENETNAWKQLLSLPVSKMTVYLSKFSVLAGLLFISSCILMIAAAALGIYLELGEDIPFAALLEYSFYPFFASLPILALHLWVATVSENQGIATMLSVVSFILTYSSHALPDWMIWKWPTLENSWNEPAVNALLGLGAGAVLYVLGMFDFVRRDVK